MGSRFLPRPWAAPSARDREVPGGLSADGRRALSGGWEPCARLWDLRSGGCLAEFGESTPVEALALSFDDRFAFVGCADRTIHVWDVLLDRRVLAIETPESITAMALAGGGRFLLVGGQGGVRVHELDWELETRAPAEWDEGARTHLETFLSVESPVAAELDPDEDATPEQIALALPRRGAPAWTDADLAGLHRALGDAGYGWLSAEGFGCKLHRMAADAGGRRHAREHA